MPIYEYLCPGCHTKFELLRRMSQADEDVICSQCQGKAKRLISTFCSFSQGEAGLARVGGSSSCTSCHGGSCASCGV